MGKETDINKVFGKMPEAKELFPQDGMKLDAIEEALLHKETPTVKWMPIESMVEEHILEDMLVLTDNNEVHAGYYVGIDHFCQYSKDGWSGKITHFALMADINKP